MLSISSLLALTRVLLGSPSGIWSMSDSEAMGHETDCVDQRERDSQSGHAGGETEVRECPLEFRSDAEIVGV